MPETQYNTRIAAMFDCSIFSEVVQDTEYIKQTGYVLLSLIQLLCLFGG